MFWDSKQTYTFWNGTPTRMVYVVGSLSTILALQKDRVLDLQKSW